MKGVSGLEVDLNLTLALHCYHTNQEPVLILENRAFNFYILLCHPLSDSAEQCLFDEILLLMAQHNYSLTKDSLDRLNSNRTEAARHLTTNLFPRKRIDNN